MPLRGSGCPLKTHGRCVALFVKLCCVCAVYIFIVCNAIICTVLHIHAFVCSHSNYMAFTCRTPKHAHCFREINACAHTQILGESALFMTFFVQDFFVEEVYSGLPTVKRGQWEVDVAARRMQCCYWPGPRHTVLRGSWFVGACALSVRVCCLRWSTQKLLLPCSGAICSGCRPSIAQSLRCYTC